MKNTSRQAENCWRLNQWPLHGNINKIRIWNTTNVSLQHDFLPMNHHQNFRLLSTTYQTFLSSSGRCLWSFWKVKGKAFKDFCFSRPGFKRNNLKEIIQETDKIEPIAVMTELMEHVCQETIPLRFVCFSPVWYNGINSVKDFVFLRK